MYLTAIPSGRDDISVQQPVSIIAVSEKSVNTAYQFFLNISGGFLLS
jgi:hypothetical protein